MVITKLEPKNIQVEQMPDIQNKQTTINTGTVAHNIETMPEEDLIDPLKSSKRII